MESLNDAEREIAIANARQHCEAAQTSALKRYWWSIMQQLIHERSPQQIRRMELAMGLRAA
jgi:hypothetical protein